MRVLVTGAGGQLAADLVAAFSESGHAIVTRTRQELDITDAAVVTSAIESLAPDVILNPAAYNRVDDAETDVTRAFDVNAFGPRVLAGVAREGGITLVHFSTDYVVDGGKSTPYLETDATVPLSAYAASKLAGEFLVRATDARHYVLRVCGLFGPAGRQTRQGNFVEKMLAAAAQGRRLRVVRDQIVAPTSTYDVAKATLRLCEAGAPYGLYHCTAEGETSWYDYACAILALADVDACVEPVTAAEFGARARRPAYSILDNRKLESTGVARPRHWREALAGYIASRSLSAEIGGS